MSKRSQQSGIQQPVEPDEALAEIVGDEPQPRPELVKKIWAYIKSHDLQDPEDRRMIKPDSKLKRVFGNKSRVSMFEVSRFLNEHVNVAV